MDFLVHWLFLYAHLIYLFFYFYVTTVCHFAYVFHINALWLIINDDNELLWVLIADAANGSLLSCKAVQQWVSLQMLR